MHTIDQSFRIEKQALAASRRRALLWKIATAAGTLALLALTAGFYLTSDYWLSSVYDEELQVSEETYQMPDQIPVYVPSIVDLPGDPIWISLADSGTADRRLTTVARPAAAEGTELPARIELLADTMISAGEEFITTIPATQQDFAFFQAQRSAASTPFPAPATQPAPAAPDTAAGTLTDAAAGWGETVDEGQAPLPDFRPTAIENNTSLALVAQQSERFRPTEDTVIGVLVERTLESVVREARFSPEEAAAADAAMKATFGVGGLGPGHVVALRGLRNEGGDQTQSLMQLSLYEADRYVGTIARDTEDRFVAAVDPWIRDDLLNRTGAHRVALPGRQYRLLDAIYSTAARNNVPTEVIGEAMMYLSRGEDLNAFASPSDRMVLLYGREARGAHGIGGRVLYIAIRGDERAIECYVLRQPNGDFGCDGGTLMPRGIANGMVTPVDGVLTSAFGPRRHPILKTVRIHKGVDWMAPAGTPIVAAFDGEISFRGDAGGYGNMIRIAHSDGRETRYAHMQRFADGAAKGASVKAGDVIGYVGTTGLSTGPHLHFELHRDGAAIDPLGTVVVAAAPGDASAAVETLVDSIIHVESAGNPRAKNPRSTATGLGQFIDSTWIRMINTYRPDLAQSLSRADLLALRFDPTISREMVRNLAREGEAYLRSRGHQITAGRLYLCHFLGMEGAHKVLSSTGGSALVDVLGAGVIRANPFLTGKSVSYVIDWAEVKMRRGKSGGSAPATVAPQIAQPSPQLEEYKTAIAAVLEAAKAAL